MDKPRLEYEQREGFVSRKQYRRLMALTLLNTILLAGFVIGPSLGPMVRTQWRQYQERRATAAARAAQAASIAAAKAYLAPAGLVVYEERPDRAAKLLADQPARYRIISELKVPYLTPRPWQPPVQTKELEVPGFSLARNMIPAAFVGALTDPQTAQRRLVVVYIDANQNFEPTIDGSNVRRTYRIHTSRRLIAQVMAEEGGRFQPTSLVLDRPGRPKSSAVWKLAGAGDFEHGQVDFTSRGLFCIYAGRSDPADPSHFTIDYELDDQRGTIDGYLRPEQRVKLLPRTGWIVDRDPHGLEAVWDPTASPPTTAPAAAAASSRW